MAADTRLPLDLALMLTGASFAIERYRQARDESGIAVYGECAAIWLAQRAAPELKGWSSPAPIPI